MSNRSVRRITGHTARIDVNPLSFGSDHEGERFAHHPIGRFRGRLAPRASFSPKWNKAEESIVLRGENVDCPRSDHLSRAGLDDPALISRNPERPSQIDRARSGQEWRMCLLHHRRNVEQMIEMRVRYEHGIRARLQMRKSIRNARSVRLDGSIQRRTPKTHAAKIGID